MTVRMAMTVMEQKNGHCCCHYQDRTMAFDHRTEHFHRRHQTTDGHGYQHLIQIVLWTRPWQLVWTRTDEIQNGVHRQNHICHGNDYDDQLHRRRIVVAGVVLVLLDASSLQRHKIPRHPLVGVHLRGRLMEDDDVAVVWMMDPSVVADATNLLHHLFEPSFDHATSHLHLRHHGSSTMEVHPSFHLARPQQNPFPYHHPSCLLDVWVREEVHHRPYVVRPQQHLVVEVEAYHQRHGEVEEEAYL
mmetsp:Transcript_53598/g.130534  ORF Transcript_53598/g.130534 Transcript_53598/m.130534 type:complete len:245 (+) Transcript_53598:668-1402(+)